MIVSMTGFGQGESQMDNWSVKVEIKAVNHRYLDISLRIPRKYNKAEETARQIIKNEISRGRIEVSINVEELVEDEPIVELNQPLVEAYHNALQKIRMELASDQEITLDHILMLPDLFKIQEAELDWDKFELVVRSALEQAVEALQVMRRVEGHALENNISAKLENVINIIDQIEEIAPTVVLTYKEQLMERISELLEGTTIDEDRVMVEVAIFADRCSIDEELVRLRSHIQQFQQSLASTEPVGRKLDFLLQEMNREINTIGSKANNGEIATHVVEIKSELEKIREQVQNIQ